MINTWDEQPDAGITFPDGFRAAAARCGLKTEGDDIALIVSDSPASTAGVFTTNRVKASCVKWSGSVAAKGAARAIIANAGNANCCNGPRGDDDNRRMAELVADSIGVRADEVMTASTGIIGRALDMERVEKGAKLASLALSSGRETDNKVARAIMTTDLVPKQTAVTCNAPSWGQPIKFGGVCKGSGMIAPNMGPPHATMLCFLTTDAGLPAKSLQNALQLAVGRSFNRITVDGDTSTNDMVLLLANGIGCNVGSDGGAFDDFVEALTRVCATLAKKVARDGEGATKLAEIVVKGAGSESAAEQIARTIAESPLVKTALYGCDPNWGRILMAAGRSGVAFDPELVDVKIGDTTVFQQGTGLPFDASAASAYLSKKDVRIVVDLHAGESEVTFWTCDFSYDYVRINAEYHT